MPTNLVEVLDVELGPNDAGASTVREYFARLLIAVWDEEEGFSGKRPFGNSSWKHELYAPLVKEGLVTGSFDEEGYVDTMDTEAADKMLREALLAFVEGS
jgi:hypothetical protein